MNIIFISDDGPVAIEKGTLAFQCVPSKKGTWELRSHAFPLDDSPASYAISAAACGEHDQSPIRIFGSGDRIFEPSYVVTTVIVFEVSSS